jgi:parvulin-like peptidyl-prolyl isomerase
MPFAQAEAWAKPLLGTPSAAARVRAGLVVAMAVIAVPRMGYSADSAVIARVNGVPITTAQVNRAVDDRVPRITGHGAISDARREALRSEVVQELIQEELIVQEAKRRKIVVSSAQLDEELAKIRKRFPDHTQYQLALSRAGLSENEVRRGLERHLLVKAAVQQEVADKVTVTEASMRAYYDADPSRFVVPEQVRYRQILIAVDPGGSPAQWDAAKRRAAQLGELARRGGNFAELAAAHSDDRTTRDAGGDMGWVHRGRLDHDQEDAIFALAPGGVSQPVRTLYGYAIYRVETKQASRALAWNEVNKPRLEEELRRAETDTRRAAWLNDLRRRAVVEMSSPEP